jgi:hypothetical protein
MATLNTIITLRQGTTAEWADSTVVLKQGEMGLEYLVDGSVKIKAGDGDKLWSALPYIGSDVKDANVFQVELGADDTDDIAAIEAQVAAEGAEKQNGDVAIVKAEISEGKYSYTSYVYDVALDVEGEDSAHGWSAMDGNYSASNVFLKDKIVLAGDYGKDSRNDKITSIGNLRIGDEIAAGTSLQALFMDMLSQRLQPSATPTAPAASITLYTDGSTNKVTAGAVEVGTTINPYYNASLSAGSYTYGPATGVAATSYSVTSTGRKTVNGATADTVEDSATASSGAFDSFTVDDDTNYKVSVSIPHNEGVPAVDNLGAPANPEVKIAAGTKTANSGAVTGYRAWFCGYKNGTNALADATAITGEQVRALGNAANGSWKSSMDVSQMKQMFFAAPAGKGYKPVIKDASTTAPQTVQGPITVSVPGANGFTAIDYDVWYVANASAASGSATLNITKT